LNGHFLIEATNRFRISRGHIPLNSSPAHLSGIWGALVAHIGPFAGYSTYKQVLFIRHSGPRLYPLTKSVGHQTSSMSCPTTYDAHKNSRWPLAAGPGPNEVVPLEVLRLIPPLVLGIGTAEQSRADQGRAEQSRAEQPRPGASHQQGVAVASLPLPEAISPRRSRESTR
jgi:hypothetical protein